MPVQVISMPSRITDTVVMRDKAGNIVSSKQIESDAPTH